MGTLNHAREAEHGRTIREMTWRGKSAREIANFIGCSEGWVARFRLRNNVPMPPGTVGRRRASYNSEVPPRPDPERERRTAEMQRRRAEREATREARKVEQLTLQVERNERRAAREARKARKAEAEAAPTTESVPLRVWYSQIAPTTLSVPARPMRMSRGVTPRPGAKLKILIPPVRDAQPPNPHRRQTIDYEDTDEL